MKKLVLICSFVLFGVCSAFASDHVDLVVYDYDGETPSEIKIYRNEKMIASFNPSEAEDVYHELVEFFLTKPDTASATWRAEVFSDGRIKTLRPIYTVSGSGDQVGKQKCKVKIL